MAVDHKAIGLRVKNARVKKGLTQENLSDETGISIPHISHIENGLTKASIDSLVAIANALGVSMDSLLYDNIAVSYEAYDKDFKDLLENCSVREKQIVLETTQQLVRSIKK